MPGSKENPLKDLRAQGGAVKDAVPDSVANYRILFDQNPLPMWVVDSEGLKFLAINDAAVERFGYTLSDLEGICVNELHASEDGTDLSGLYSDAGAAHRVTYKRKGGGIIRAELSTQPLAFDDRAAVLCVLNSQQRLPDALSENEARLRALLD